MRQSVPRAQAPPAGPPQMLRASSRCAPPLCRENEDDAAPEQHKPKRAGRTDASVGPVELARLDDRHAWSDANAPAQRRVEIGPVFTHVRERLGRPAQLLRVEIACGG